jgi:membrane protein DedA with SNARE-associated domain
MHRPRPPALQSSPPVTPVLASVLDDLLSNYGYLAVFSIVAIESLGIPAPGETMLVTAAVYAGATGNLEIVGVIAAAALGAIIGDNIGYAIGRRGGFRLLLKYGHKLHIKESHLKVARYVFDRYGGKVVFFGRFIAILRTYAAFLAGVGQMEWKRFLVANAAGGIVWATIFGLLGYFGQKAFEKLSTPINIALAAIGIVAVVVFTVALRRRTERLAEVAEQAYPGPLTDADRP